MRLEHRGSSDPGLGAIISAAEIDHSGKTAVGFIGAHGCCLTFGMGALGAAVLGGIADMTNIGYVYQICSFLPLIGLVTWSLPNIEGSRQRAKASA